jgi:hypothetical protein
MSVPGLVGRVVSQKFIRLLEAIHWEPVLRLLDCVAKVGFCGEHRCARNSAIEVTGSLFLDGKDLRGELAGGKLGWVEAT